jgi:hypothetical protein
MNEKLDTSSLPQKKDKQSIFTDIVFVISKSLGHGNTRELLLLMGLLESKYLFFSILK